MIRGENFDRWPQVLPGADAVLFASHTKGPTWDNASIGVRSLKSNRAKTLLQGGYDACQLGSCGPVSMMRADGNGDVYFVMQYTPSGMTPPDFIYELRKVDRQGQLVAAIPLIQPPIYHEATDGSSSAL